MLKEVILREKEALEQLLNVADSYEGIVECLNACKGRIVFMGVGKSGHIAEKLAATFASLGVPSFFVHSTEAMHGDLGMIQPQDIAVLVSNSGTTKEVVQNIAPLQNNGVTTVAFTSDGESELARRCDHKIVYPHLREADDLNLAPTVSSTLTLTLGDALACELSKRRNFTRADFYRYHPNGALGQMLSKE